MIIGPGRRHRPPAEAAETQERVRQALERELARVDSPEVAEAIAQRLDRLAAGTTEQQRGAEAAHSPASAAGAVEGATHIGSPADEAAAVLVKAAEEAVAPTPEEAVAPTPEAPEVIEAAQRVLMERPVPEPPEVQRGRSLLKEAILHRMGRLQALDARLYLAVNGFPHAGWSDQVANLVTVWATGGWIWAGSVLLARLAGVPRSPSAFWELLPSMIGATWIVEYPVKALFRRRRPFIDIVRALVVGKQPGSWSFPSGHTASSFACAWVLSTVWTRRAPLFFTLASIVGFSRIYVGAHYPGDVLSGALFGAALSELIRRLARRAFRQFRPAA